MTKRMTPGIFLILTLMNAGALRAEGHGMKKPLRSLAFVK